MSALLKLIPGEIWAWLGGLVGVSLAFVGGQWAGKRSGKEQERARHLQKTIEKGKEGRNAAHDEREATDGMSDSDIADRVRKRERVWRGL